MQVAGRGTERRGKVSALRRLRLLISDVSAVSKTAFVEPEVRRAMTRTGYGLGLALAVVAALSVHAALHALR